VTLSVIGAGFGRTGTFSLNSALEILGLGPCHHMEDVNRSDTQKQLFRAAGRGESIDWDAAYAGFNSAVDWPTAYFWRELAAYYPKAKIILTVRDADAWYKSTSETIIHTVGEKANPESFGVAVVRKKIFADRFDDADFAKSVFLAHNAQVIATIPSERLLVFEVKQGWAPLCSFLGLPVPTEDFPVSNSTASFRAAFFGKK
jgi:Sulfotransferase domain